MPDFEVGDLVTAIYRNDFTPYAANLLHYRPDGTLVQEIGSGDIGVGRLAVDNDLSVYNLVQSSADGQKAITKFAVDGSPAGTFTTNVFGTSQITTFTAAWDGSLYMAHPNPTDPFDLDDHVYKYAADGSFVAEVAGPFAGTSSIFGNDIDVQCDNCELVIVTTTTTQIARADGCLLVPLADFANPADATNDNVAVVWLADGGIGLATQRRGIVRYDADGAVMWETGYINRGWNGIDVAADGQSLWASVFPESGAFPAGAVSRLSQFDIETGAMLFEFQPEHTTDADVAHTGFYSSGVAVIRQCGGLTRRRTMLASVVG